MIRRAMIAAAMLLVAACGSSAAGPGVSAKCGPTAAHTVATSRVARVYSVNKTVYGCSDTTGKRSRLGVSSNCVGSARVGPLKLVGSLVGYGLESCGVDTGSTVVIVRRLTDGKQLRSDPATTRFQRPESYSTVASLLLASDGADAWIATAQSLGTRTGDTEVHKDDRGGAKLLDIGNRISPSSLRLRDSMLSWKHGSTTRTAALR